MYECTTGQVEEYTKSGQRWYRLRLNLVDKTAKTRAERYKNKYINTGLLVGGKTDRIKNERVAQEMLTKAIREYTPVGSEMSFHDYCEYWLDEKKKDRDLSTTTKEGYEYKVKHILRFFEDKELTLGEITADDLRQFQYSLYTVEKKAVSQRKDVGLSERTIRDIMVLIKQIFNDAINYGHLIGKNPAAVIKLPKKKKKEDDLPYIGEDEIPVFKQALAANCDGHFSLECAYLIGLFYGLRREEICGLRWSAIRNGDIHIEHTVVRMKTLVAKDSTKTEASNRSCAILPEIEEMLEKIKSSQEEYKKVFGNTYHDSDYIFTWEDGRPFTPDYLTKKFRKIIDRTEGLDNRLHLHDLRVSCVSILVNNGVSIKDVQKWVGHEDVETTLQIYARTSRKRQYETGKLMEKILF